MDFKEFIKDLNFNDYYRSAEQHLGSQVAARKFPNKGRNAGHDINNKKRNANGMIAKKKMAKKSLVR